MISSIPASSMLFATDGEIPESVMMTSTWSSVQIFPNPLFPNLEESARTIVRSEAAIIRWLSRASSMFEVVSPKSRSIPCLLYTSDAADE